MMAHHRIILYVLLLHGLCQPALGHETDDDISFLRIEFPSPGIWKATARLDGEAIFLSLAEGWPNEVEYARLKALYWDFSKTGAELRLIFLEALARQITFQADGRVLARTYTCSKDPAFDYAASLGQSFWGLVEYRGELPEKTESFVAQIPASYYPLQYEIRLSEQDETLKELFRPRSGREPRPFLLRQARFADAPPQESAP